MADYDSLSDFLVPVNKSEISGDTGYKNGQLGNYIIVHENGLPDIQAADIIFLGCSEQRGSMLRNTDNESLLLLRRELYKLYFWHNQLVLADLGDIALGATLQDTYAALRTVIGELLRLGKTVIILGASHDLTLAQYQAHTAGRQSIDACCVDALLDIDIEEPLRRDNFLMEMLTGEPNFIRQYNHIGFQSYYVHPRMLETMDKLRFDCFRVGKVKEQIEEMEPVIRNTALFSFDLSAIAHAYCAAGAVSPNGLTGEEACTLMKYAGMSPQLGSAGIYGYDSSGDPDGMSARQISQMIWYFIDGKASARRESDLRNREDFIEYNTSFTELETTFLQSKKTGRWWMRLSGEEYIACSYNDYLLARSNEIPERWLRARERS